MKLRSKKHPGQTWFATLSIYFFGSVILRLFYKIKIEGGENIPKEGALIVLAKHQRLNDIPLGCAAFYVKARRRLWCIMKDSLSNPFLGGYLLKCGGIPIDRKNPEKTKESFTFAKHVLHHNQVLTLFPEQTFFPWKMGRGKVPGFRVLAGKPAHPLQVICVGFEYGKEKWGRTSVTIRIGKVSYFTKEDSPELFLHEKMKEIASLSNLEYNFPVSTAKEESEE
ncbi:MAG TPA: lysophospholipid acyltransferase family protein [Leptospiraceae bacterium]|nr:lysophospholipid acyltransferase family protein [Leptospiraceae bacterium]HMW05342.1 lysophospholipid acyltransferase family protein [Leptospiraceae bacterium]HMX34517.1 lysophospholipid acyltransferase family protein [Leptospiraceae bacterium]HMY31537.1 lysophospholipid acyltransferase family protein [Leptospiraceae bacterium]HMZ65903.1 lysophospholipid acyltransferase family protein [Leptospiraceae bacterium]